MPRRRQQVASLHPNLFRWNVASSRLDITVHPERHVLIDHSSVANPLFRKYGEASNWKFRLTVRPSDLLFQFRVPNPLRTPESDAGIDLNFRSADVATSDGVHSQVELRSITRIQERMVLKRQSIQRHIQKDLRHQRAVLRRYNKREHHRVTHQLHRAANEILRVVGERTLVFENLTDATESIQRRGRGQIGPVLHRQLSAWTHGRLVEFVSCKAQVLVIRVNPEGTSSECPRCGGRLALPSGRKVDRHGRMTRETNCNECGGRWHRDAAAAIAVLARGRRLLRGEAVTPSARNALLEAAIWRPTEGSGVSHASRSGPLVEPMKEDDAKSEEPTSRWVSG